MAKLTDLYKARVAQILSGEKTTNISITKAQFGTDNTPAEDATDTALQAAVDTARVAYIQKTVGNQTVVAWFWPKTTFSAISLTEFAAYFGDDVLALRDTINEMWPIDDADDYDIRVDITITHDQA